MPLERVTIQWSITSEALNRFNHAFGGTWGGNPCSFHHNLFACNTGRNPSIGMNGEFDFRNNVIFNWAHRTADGGDGSSRVNLVNNYFKPGPATEGDLRHRIAKMQARWQGDDHPGCGLWYIDGQPRRRLPEDHREQLGRRDLLQPGREGQGHDRAPGHRGRGPLPRAVPVPAGRDRVRRGGLRARPGPRRRLAPPPRPGRPPGHRDRSARAGRPSRTGSSTTRPTSAAGPSTRAARPRPTPTATACPTPGSGPTA